MTTTGERGVYQAGVEARLPYLAFDADNHIYPPEDAETRFLEKQYIERVFPGGKSHLTTTDFVGDEHKAKTLGFHTVGLHGGTNPLELPEMKSDIPIPGAMLNKMNAGKGLDKEGLAKLVETYREMEPAFEDHDLRLALMDSQGVQAAVVHAGSGADAPFQNHDATAGYAAARAWNRYLESDWGYAYQERIFTPCYIPLYDIDLAVEELERCIKQGVRLVGLNAKGSYGRSPADPYFDPFWSRVNEADLNMVVHLGATLNHRGAEWSEDPNGQYAQFNGFQWLTQWSDFPIMETTAMLVFHGLLARFPNINVLIAEFGVPWIPYWIRKLDHAHLAGRKPKWGGDLTMRPSEMFKSRCVIAPFPEENVQRAIDVIGSDCLVFGSDFPHSEGIPDPIQYVTQLKNQPDEVVKAVMRDNLARFLGKN